MNLETPNDTQSQCIGFDLTLYSLLKDTFKDLDSSSLCIPDIDSVKEAIRVSGQPFFNTVEFRYPCFNTVESYYSCFNTVGCHYPCFSTVESHYTCSNAVESHIITDLVMIDFAWSHQCLEARKFLWLTAV